MPKRFPDITCFVDVAGRYSYSKHTPLVCAAVGMWTSEVNEIRESLITVLKSDFQKWSDSKNDPQTVKAIFRLIAKRQLYAFVNIIWKSSVEWEAYHQDGQRIYAKGVQKAQEAISFAKPINTLKLHLFGIAAADLFGYVARLNRNRLPRKDTAFQRVTVTGVFDSDIQGETNQAIAKNVIEGVSELPMTETATRLRVTFKTMIQTEQEEPLLLLADHLAGFHYSKKCMERVWRMSGARFSEQQSLSSRGGHRIAISLGKTNFENAICWNMMFLI